MTIDKTQVKIEASKLAAEVGITPKEAAIRVVRSMVLGELGVPYDPKTNKYNAGECANKLEAIRDNAHSKAANDTVNAKPTTTHVDNWLELLPLQLLGVNIPKIRTTLEANNPKWKDGVESINLNLEALGLPSDWQVDTGGRKAKRTIRVFNDALADSIPDFD